MQNEDSSKIVIEAVNDEYNVEYPMIKEISFRESITYSYQIEQVNQIFIAKGEQDESKFISNDTMKRESGRNVENPLNSKILVLIELMNL